LLLRLSSAQDAERERSYGLRGSLRRIAGNHRIGVEAIIIIIGTDRPEPDPGAREPFKSGIRTAS